jgi:growth arrest-specific protein 8
MKKTRDALDRRRKDEIKAIEDRKLIMIEQLMNEHQKEFTDIKNYYNDITHNNLDLIKSLKEEVKDLEAEDRNDQIRLNEKRAENKKLSAPLKKMQEDLVRLKGELEEYKKEKAEGKRVKAALVVVEEEHKGLVWEFETLSQRFADLKTERDELRTNFHASVFDVKQKSAFRSLLLQKKLAAMQRVQEEREAQLVEVLSRANLDPTVLGQVKGHIDDVLQRKNAEARDLQGEVVRLQALHEELRSAVAAKLKDYGLSMVELGFDPSATSLSRSKRILALTGASDTGPAKFSETF